jgi:hypothetical protein
VSLLFFFSNSLPFGKDWDEYLQKIDSGISGDRYGWNLSEVKKVFGMQMLSPYTAHWLKGERRSIKKFIRKYNSACFREILIFVDLTNTF